MLLLHFLFYTFCYFHLSEDVELLQKRQTSDPLNQHFVGNCAPMHSFDVPVVGRQGMGSSPTRGILFSSCSLFIMANVCLESGRCARLPWFDAAFIYSARAVLKNSFDAKLRRQRGARSLSFLWPPAAKDNERTHTIQREFYSLQLYDYGETLIQVSASCKSNKHIHPHTPKEKQEILSFCTCRERNNFFWWKGGGTGFLNCFLRPKRHFKLTVWRPEKIPYSCINSNKDVRTFSTW